MRYILAIDQGTTSTRAILFGGDGAPLSVAQREFKQIYPHPGWVEHDPAEIWDTTLTAMRDALQKAAPRPTDVVAIGIANQRETTLIWNRETGEPIYNAIVWQDRRTADLCARMVADGCEDMVGERSGLLIDPYFSATKICWMLDHVPGARARAENGELAFGTVDTYLVWRLTRGTVHATDATNASRTLLFNIRSGCWDEELLRLFRVPASLLPQVRDTAGEFGVTAAEIFATQLPILAVAGDQQAALIGQACLKPGMVKATYGTGGFILLNTGSTAVRSRHRLLTTIAYQWNGTRHYALEGSIFVAGAAVQWLRDALGIIASSAQADEFAAQADPEQLVYFVPAFVGLGAPHWDSNARGTIVGLTRGTTRKELARAALESVGFQTRDLLAAMYADAGDTRQQATARPVIRVDGGMSASDWTMQFLADVLDVQVDRPTVRETTALGAALLAGWQAGVVPAPDAFSTIWHLDRSFRPMMPENIRDQRCRGWRDAMARTLLPAAH
ncbi:MAG: glycerol kinase GlpK [Hyphomicrobiales bacterium]|nr:glycerol kinase GlpK [Hyphomicrobiales bacterium]